MGGAWGYTRVDCPGGRMEVVTSGETAVTICRCGKPDGDREDGR